MTPAPRAVLWDMDGVIADTAPLHYRAWRAAFDHRSQNFTRDYFDQTFGQRNDAIIRGFLGADVPDAVIDGISAEKEAAYREIAAREVVAAPGVKELLADLNTVGYRQALASAAPRANIDLVIRVLGIEQYFGALVDGGEVREGKPDPEVFSLAAARLGAAPENCLVIEDAVHGVTAARRAGMHVIAVTSTHDAAALAAADLVTVSLARITVADIDIILDGKPIKGVN